MERRHRGGGCRRQLGRDNSNNNNGYGTITAPGNDPYVITVGAMKTMGTDSLGDDLIASYSSKGPTLFDHIVKPDIVAPGNQIISTAALPSRRWRLPTPATTLPTHFYAELEQRTESVLLPVERHQHGHAGG